MNSQRKPDVTKLEAVVNRLSAVIYEYWVRPDGRSGFSYVSPYCQQLLGVSVDELLTEGYDFRQWIAEEDKQSFEDSLMSAIRERREFSWQGRVINQGRQIWISARSVPEVLQDGTVVFSGIFQDITGQVTLERERSEIEYRLISLLERLPLIVAMHQDGRLVSVNAYGAKVMGVHDPGTLIGSDVLSLIHPGDRERVVERMQNALRGVAGEPAEIRFLTPANEEILVETITFPMLFKGRPAVQVVARDLREEKAMRAEHRKIETLFFELFRHSPMPVVMLDEQGNVVRVNQGFEVTFGYEEKELLGNSLNQFIVPPELESEGNDLNSLISSSNVVRIETVRTRKDGTPLATIVYGVPVHMEDKTIGIFGVYVDITERKRVEEELKVRNAELDNFVYKVSHDLRAPLSSILGLVQLANMKGNNDNLLDYLQIVERKVTELDHFISDVLSHSKNLKQEVSVSEIDFRQMIDSSFSNLSYLKDADHVEKKVSIEGVAFYSDRWRVAEIFRNLISNAIKYRRQDITHPAISIRIIVDEDRATIVFADNGIGISEENLEKVFDMFYRASEKSDGSGLGLYIVKNAVDKLGGDIDVTSRLHQGTTFTIHLLNQRLRFAQQQS